MCARVCVCVYMRACVHVCLCVCGACTNQLYLHFFSQRLNLFLGRYVIHVSGSKQNFFVRFSQQKGCYFLFTPSKRQIVKSYISGLRKQSNRSTGIVPILLIANHHQHLQPFYVPFHGEASLFNRHLLNKKGYHFSTFVYMQQV